MAQKVTFIVSAEIVADAVSGILLGDFNNWEYEQGIALKKQKDGSLKTVVSLEAGTYQYRYLLNDGRWVNDGNADSYAPSHDFFVENCVITVAAEVEKATKAKKVTPVVVEGAAPVVAKKAAKAKKVEVVAETVAPVVEKKATKPKKEAVAEPVTAKKAPAKAKK